MNTRCCGRAVKKMEIKANGGHAAAAVHNAYYAGLNEGAYGCKHKPKRNPYPAGVRHDSWDRGFRHGRYDRAMGRTASCWN